MMLNIFWNFFSTTNIVEEAQDYSTVIFIIACLTGATILEIFFRFRHEESFFFGFIQNKVKTESKQNQFVSSPISPSSVQPSHVQVYNSARITAHYQKCKKCQSGKKYFVMGPVISF
jgi:hypothetical protein